MSKKVPPSRYISDGVKFDLFLNSNRQCNKCKIYLIQRHESGETTNTSEKAHIVAFSKNGPRAIDGDINNNSYENLMMLCANCHIIVDNAPIEYPVEVLKKMKAEHEREVAEIMEIAMATFSFPELEAIIEQLVNQDFSEIVDDDLQVISPDDKLEKNNLSHKVKQMIQSGMVRYNELELFFGELQKNDPKKREKVVNSFKAQYYSLKSDYEGDDLFYELLQYTQSGFYDDKQRQSGLALLSYLFVICEVFEKE